LPVQRHAAPDGAPDYITAQGALVFKGGNDVGDPCQARAHHGFNGIEREVVDRIAAWITKP